MTSDDRRFYGILSLVFGALFISGGWLAAFTRVGALLILVGVIMLVASPILLRSLRVALAALALVGLGLGWPILVTAS